MVTSRTGAMVYKAGEATKHINIALGEKLK